MSASPPITLDQLRQDIARVLEEPVDDLGPDDNLLDLGMDSIQIMRLVEHWSRNGAQASLIDLAEDPTLNGWLAHLRRTV